MNELIRRIYFNIIVQNRKIKDMFVGAQGNGAKTKTIWGVELTISDDIPLKDYWK